MQRRDEEDVAAQKSWKALDCFGNSGSHRLDMFPGRKSVWTSAVGFTFYLPCFLMVALNLF